MLLILLLILSLFIKNYTISKPATYEAYSYVWALGVPLSLILIVSSDILYERFVAKF